MAWKWQDNVGCWQAWLTEAATQGDAEEVRRRLEQVPDAMREQVRDHARTVWRIASKSETSGGYYDDQAGNT